MLSYVVLCYVKVHIFWEEQIFFEIFTVDLTVTTKGKSTVDISQTFVAFSENMNFMIEFLE